MNSAGDIEPSAALAAIRARAQRTCRRRGAGPRPPRRNDPQRSHWRRDADERCKSLLGHRSKELDCAAFTLPAHGFGNTAVRRNRRGDVDLRAFATEPNSCGVRGSRRRGGCGREDVSPGSSTGELAWIYFFFFFFFFFFFVWRGGRQLKYPSGSTCRAGPRLSCRRGGSSKPQDRRPRSAVVSKGEPATLAEFCQRSAWRAWVWKCGPVLPRGSYSPRYDPCLGLPPRIDGRPMRPTRALIVALRWTPTARTPAGHADQTRGKGGRTRRDDQAGVFAV